MTSHTPPPDDDLLRFHNGDTLHNIPVIRDDKPQPRFPWQTVGTVAGIAALVGATVGVSFGLGDRHHPAQTAAAAVTATPAPTPATTTPPPAPSPPVVTATATATVQAPTQTQTVYAAPAEGTDSDSTTAESVVEQYYAAVNAAEYQSAWELGGKNMSPSYDAFVSGYADTTYTQVQVTSTDGDTVYVRIDALRNDGSAAAFTGSYTVDPGLYEISHGSLTQVS
ncbi:hypothetical protein ACFZCP_35150 [Streptomyces sp. NPDC007971]|uniref:hypothetical protein n=1 Tax=Streptomyces sp. NPDC007971 TaxID=3364799 RepID=UPI0036E0EAF4